MSKSSLSHLVRPCCTGLVILALGLAPAACDDDDVQSSDDLEVADDPPDHGKKPKKPKKPKEPETIEPLCVLDQCSDTIVDARLRYTVSNFGFPSEALALGTQLRIFGREYPCYDSPCATSWAVIRDLDSGALISAYFGKPYPSAEVLSHYGETPESWLAPLTVDAGDFGNCEPYDSGCGDGTVLQRGAVEFGNSEDAARILDGTHGWAPEGYYANVRDWTLGDASCQYSLWSGRANVIRSSCKKNHCPAPDFAEGCGAEQGPYDELWIQFVGLLEDPEGPFDATCQVIAALDQVITLDCVYSEAPGEFEPLAD